MKSVKWSRRSFLRTAGAFGAAAVAFDPKGLARIDEASQSMAGRTPEDVAQDEFYWRESPAGLQARPLAHQPQQRLHLPHAAGRAGFRRSATWR